MEEQVCGNDLLGGQENIILSFPSILAFTVMPWESCPKIPNDAPAPEGKHPSEYLFICKIPTY